MTVRIHTMDPFPKLTHRDLEFAVFQEGATIRDYVPASHVASEYAVCIRNGKMIEPDSWDTTPVEFGDDLSFVEFPGAATGLIVVDAIITAVIAYGVSEGINAFFGQPEGDQPFENAPDPTYAFAGISNTAASGIGIAILYGVHKIGGNFIDVRLEGNNPFISGQSFGNLLDVTLALCEGEVFEIIETRINGNDINTYGSTVTQFAWPGSNDQPTVGGGGAGATFAVGLELLSGAGNPYDPATWVGGEVRSYTTSQEIDRLQINILHPEGLVHIDEQSGFNHPQGVNYQTRYKKSGDPSFSSWVQTHLVSNVTSPFTSTSEIVFPEQGIYEIEVRKLSVEPNTSFFRTRLDWDGVTEFIDDGFTYPNTVVSRIRIEADRSLSGGLPTITHKLRGIKVQAWDGVSESNPNFVDAYPYRNPAWIALDYILNTRYGLGRWVTIEQVDLPSFLEWAEWCDELVSDGKGGTEARCYFDGVFDNAGGNAWDRLLQIGATARASFVMVGDLIKVKVEKPRTPTQLFTMGNIRRGSWRQSWVRDKIQPTRFEIVYLNEEQDYTRDDEGVDDEDAIAQGLPQRVQSISRMGITRRSQALREARFALNLHKLNQVVSFQADIDAVTCEVGDLVQVAHDVPQWGFSGRLSATSVNASQVVLDRDVTLEAGEQYEIIVRHGNDARDVLEITSAAGDYSAGTALTLAAAATQLPEKGSLYAFGRVNISTKTIKVTAIRTSSDLSRSIEGVVYDPRIHDDDIGLLDEIVTTELPEPGLIPGCVSNLTATQVVTTSGGATTYAVKLRWDWPAGNIGGATLWYRDITGYVAAGTTSQDPFTHLSAGVLAFPQNEITITTAGLSLGSTYEFAVMAQSASGASRSPGSCGTATLEITGGGGPVPESPTNLVATQSGDDLIITWDAPSGTIPISHYEVRRGVEWVGSREVGQSSGTSLVTQRWAPTENSTIQERFFVRAVSQSGDYGDTATLIANAGGLLIWNGGTATQRDEVPAGWSGSKTNLQVVSSRLELVTDTDPGTYLSPVLDTGSLGAYRIGAVLHASQGSGLTWGTSGLTWTGITGQGTGWVGNVDPATWRNQFALDFQASADGVAYSDFVPLITQTVNGVFISGTWVTPVRYFRVRLVVTPSDPAFPPYVSQLLTTIESR